MCGMVLWESLVCVWGCVVGGSCLFVGCVVLCCLGRVV